VKDGEVREAIEWLNGRKMAIANKDEGEDPDGLVIVADTDIAMRLLSGFDLDPAEVEDAAAICQQLVLSSVLAGAPANMVASGMWVDGLAHGLRIGEMRNRGGGGLMPLLITARD
jgi:hypothetical protein